MGETAHRRTGDEALIGGARACRAVGLAKAGSRTFDRFSQRGGFVWTDGEHRRHARRAVGPGMYHGQSWSGKEDRLTSPDGSKKT
jgi:hypothetical protein